MISEKQIKFAKDVFIKKTKAAELDATMEYVAECFAKDDSRGLSEWLNSKRNEHIVVTQIKKNKEAWNGMIRFLKENGGKDYSGI